MPKKALPPDPSGPVAGYLRVSNVVFPDDCKSAECRAAFVEGLRRMKMGELMADAARDGETITDWYDDLGISGRGEFLADRLAFARLTRDATEGRSGRVRLIYARDLSRLFRDLTGQEAWFLQMEQAGCAVRIADLPFIADKATRDLIRQQIGALNQYLAVRSGALIRLTNRERVRAGLWVGTAASLWGLAYNRDTKGFDHDPLTADRIVFLFETVRECGGVGARAARRMNGLVRDGHPRASPAPGGGHWTAHAVLRTVRNRLWAREATYCGGADDELRVPMPHLIPEVVPPNLVADVWGLLDGRAPANTLMAERAKAARLDYTYGGLMTCAMCGGRMQSARPRGTVPGEQPAWIAWRCAGAREQHRPREARCPSGAVVQQSRIDALVGRAVRHALADALRQSAPPPPRAAQGRGRTAQGDARVALDRLEARRRRYHEMYAAGHVKTLGELEDYLRPIEAERLRLTAPPADHQPNPEGAATPALSAARCREFLSAFDAVWATPDAPVLDFGKRGLLGALGVGISVHPLPEMSRGAQPRPRGRARRRFHGPLTLTVEARALSLTTDVTETEEEFRGYWERRWDYARGPWDDEDRRQRMREWANARRGPDGRIRGPG